MKCAFAGTDRSALLARVRGALLGAAVGDALGGPVEFMGTAEIRSVHGVHREMTGGGWLGLRPGQITDDTEMSLEVARTLANEGCLNPEVLAGRFADWYRRNPVDIGMTCRRGIERYLQTGQAQVPADKSHIGNGALMRTHPVAVASLCDGENLRQWTLAQAHVTHNGALSDRACLFFGELLQLALAGEGLELLKTFSDEFAAEYPPFAFENGPCGTSGRVTDTLCTVLASFFATDRFEECLVKIVNLGGDADTNASLGGALAGAFYGFDAIPRRWLGRLEAPLRTELNLLSEKLLALGLDDHRERDLRQSATPA